MWDNAKVVYLRTLPFRPIRNEEINRCSMVSVYDVNVHIYNANLPYCHV
jgi:hypothetical protein